MTTIRSLALPILLIAVTGCKQRTELMIGVITELRAPDVMDEVRLDVETGDHESNLTPILLPGSDWTIGSGQVGTFVLPGSYGLNSSDGTEPALQIKITGLKGGTPVVERSARVSMVGQKTLFMRMGLVVGCMGNFQCNAEAGESCIEGQCRDSHVDARTLPEFRAELVDHVDCSSGEHFIDTSKCTGGNCAEVPTLGDMQCAGTCVEGLCYNPPPDGGTSGGPLWQPQPLPATVGGKAKLLSVWGTTQGGYDVFAVGDRGDGTGVALHLSGPAGQMGSGGGGGGGTGGDFLDLGAASAPAFAVGWAEETLPAGTPALNGVSGSGSNDVWAVGAGSTIVHRVNGTWMTTQNPQVPAGLVLNSIALDAPNEGFIVGIDPTNGGGGLRWDGVQWHPDNQLSSLPPRPRLNAVAAQSGFALAAGDNGAMYGFANNVWAPFNVIDQITGRVLWGAGGDGTVGYAVGQQGTIVLVKGAVMAGGATATLMSSPVSSDLFAVFGVAPGNVYIGGAGGVILHATDGANFSPEPSNTTNPITSLWGASPSDIYAVGESGTLLHSTGGGDIVTPMRDGGASMGDAGATFCPSGQTMCSGQCTNTAFDPNNCVECGLHCAANEICNNGCVSAMKDMGGGGGCGPGQLANTIGMPVVGFDTDGTFVYFVGWNGTSGFAGKQPVCGGTITMFPQVTSMLNNPGALVTNGIDIWGIHNAGDNNVDAGAAGMQLVDIDVNGTIKRTGVGLGSFQPNPQTALAIDAASNVYWLGAAGPWSAASVGSVSMIASGSGDPRSIAIDSMSFVYWSSGAQLMRTKVGTGIANPCGSGTIIRGLAAVTSMPDAWFADESNGSVYDVLKGSTAIGMISPPAGFMTTDGTNLYIATFAGSNDTLLKMPTSGGAGQPWMSGLSAPVTMHVDASNVYVLNQGVIMRTPK